MAGDKFHSIGEILRSRINTPLVWGILLLTLALTVLFYFSQKQQQEVYNRYIETLSDYKFFASRIMQKMERVRIAPETDPAPLMSSLRGLRETAVSVYAASENARSVTWMPEEREFERFENAAIGWVASVNRYIPQRVEWLDSAGILLKTLNRWNVIFAEPLVTQIDSARMGFAVVSDSLQMKKLPDSLRIRFIKLLEKNAEMTALWNRIDSDESLVRCDNLLQAFKMQSLQNREMKFWIQQVFYLISIVLLLFTLFFVVRSRK